MADYRAALRNKTGEMMIVRKPLVDHKALARAMAGVAIASVINGAMRCAFKDDADSNKGCFVEGVLRTWDAPKPQDVK